MTAHPRIQARREDVYQARLDATASRDWDVSIAAAPMGVFVA